MKKILFSAFLLVAAVISPKAQVVSESDVLAYLDGKTFKKESVGATLTFHEAGSKLTVNGSSIFSRPDVSILTSTMALVIYWGVTDPSVKAGLMVDHEKNTVTDRTNGSVYTLETLRQLPDTVYCIQIAASKTYIEPSSLKSKFDLPDDVLYFTKDGWYKYVFGQFGSSNEATARMNSLGLKGFITQVDASVLKQK